MKEVYYEYAGIEKFNGNNTIVVFKKPGTFTRPLKITIKELFATRKDIVKDLDGETAAGLAKFIDDNTTITITEPTYQYKYLLFLSALFVGAVNSAHFLSSLHLYYNEWRFGFAIFSMTISFILNVVITEVYGFKNARSVLWSSLIISIITTLVQLLYVILSSQNSEYTNALPINTTASITAYFLSDFYNNKILVKLKNDQKSLLYRVFASNMFAHIVDTIIYMSLTQFFKVPLAQVIVIIYQGIMIKIVREVFLVLPIVMVLSNYLKKKEGIPVSNEENNTSFLSINSSYSNVEVSKISKNIEYA